MPRKVRVRRGLRAFEGRELLGYADIAAATGLEEKTIRNYVKIGKLHAGIRPGVYLPTDQRLRQWVIDTNQRDQGYRSDLYGYPGEVV